MFDFVKVIAMVFLMLIPLANPLVAVTLMMSLGARLSTEEKHKQAKDAAKYSLIVMLISFYCGQLVMQIFGISIPGLRIAGGLIVMVIGFQMLFPPQNYGSTPELESKKDELKNRAAMNLAFIPLTMPGFAGPGTIAMVISIASTLPNFGAPTWVTLTAPVFSFIALCLFLWFCLRSSEFIIRKLGQSGIEVISRVMGFLLVCMGVQFCINGVVELLHHTQL
ncbi:stress protection protein MarC [Wohlfahrtiimonas chitiniclastica]|uniref:MarC family NAAT transporter n=1 Tax=Wohlfahrtiimonas chitiniclastica TaxID=400946 RepID=UPI000B9842E0|nr:MarC family NAAT transporter [Wohlfahrtiimonas chitiniclastica]MBS7818170.1 MarC family NAAT transporter [Wohlfahrtiimonas chitiniclastica]MBS7826080.1 MarC family NAAT transporter [Wohlfahrtiimonas chitiniclastica]MBS7835907.1 MarC family NAAT transporter [Wohlfahrtiimonas chitiniclastica]MDC7252118.1 UPF0056 inner membrane protein MarC [Wohlfahrtiimonas chitiniclastica]OYQ69929.1 stress protection protein MarC [Wohlfahrtiimonas chitiniclastica]